MSREAGLASVNGLRIALKSVHVDMQVDGLLSTAVITQRYRNDSKKKLEIVYTFPLAWGTELLSMEVVLGKRRMRAVVAGKAEAWEQYEEALAANDSPILVERTALDLYTANLGNIESGENVIVELRCAQLLRFEGDTLSVRIPCVVAPRYGDPHQDGDLATRESVDSDILAEYPLNINIIMWGQVARAKIARSSHEYSIIDTEECKEIVLQAGAMLDRDFFIVLAEKSDAARALIALDGDEHIMMASFRPRLPIKSGPIRVKILLDCSGSMAGFDIESARRMIRCFLAFLYPNDLISIDCIGDEIQHVTAGMVACSKQTRENLHQFITNVQADMGGAKIGHVLARIFTELSTLEKESAPECILLVTNGATWEAEKIIQAGSHSGCRVFVAGIGTTPAESLLQELAETTGGACVFVPFWDDETDQMITVVQSVIEMMRSAYANSVYVKWADEPLWQSRLPNRFHDGKTVHVFASFAQEPKQPPALCWSVEGREEHLIAGGIKQTQGDVLPRLAGARRMAEAESCEEARELALKHQLLGKQSALFLTEQKEDEKTFGLPFVHTVPQMMPAGYSGFGWPRRIVVQKNIDDVCFHECSTELSTRKQNDKNDVDDSYVFKIFGLIRPTLPIGPNPLDLLQAFSEHSLQMVGDEEIIRETIGILMHTNLYDFLAAICRRCDLNMKQVGIVLLHWLSDAVGNSFELSIQAQRVLSDQMGTIPKETRAEVIGRLQQAFPEVNLEAW